jgi:drug/metabolite transporter (DMT)-like permease
MIISSFFVNWDFIKKHFFTKYSILLMVITMIHVYTSYRGFQLLDSGISYALFYTYPIIIIFLDRKYIPLIMIFTFIGIYMLSQEDNTSKNKLENEKEKFRYEGIIMILIAAFTEAFIYFIVRNIKTDNSWNHLFLSYFIGAIILTIYQIIINKNNIIIFENFNLYNKVTISLIINSLIGLFGYLFRFYTISKLPPMIYAPLSYFGIIMAFIYGYTINNEKININKILGSLFIIIPNIYILIKNK